MTGEGDERRIRYASRVLLYDPQGRILLFLDGEYQDPPERAKWVTPGGGIEDGEDASAAAVRELYEETGLVVSKLGPAVYSVEVPVHEVSVWQTHAHWDFFVHRVAAPFEPSVENWTEKERRAIRAFGWWSPEEVAALVEGTAPENLADLARRFSAEAEA